MRSKNTICCISGEYDVVRTALDGEYKNMMNYGPLHDNIARVATALKDKQLFNMTIHHPRELLEDYGKDSESIRFIVDYYIEQDYKDGNDTPSYVWAACSLESAKIISEAWDDIPCGEYLSECCDEVKKHFGYIPRCKYCDEYHNNSHPVLPPCEP